MLAVRRGVVGALASGDARVRRACGAVRKGARAEAGWCRAPHARAEGFMGVRLRTFWTWPTKGPGFRLAVDAWRAFTAGLEPLQEEDVPAHDDRVTQLVAAAQQAARQVRLDPACT